MASGGYIWWCLFIYNRSKYLFSYSLQIRSTYLKHRPKVRVCAASCQKKLIRCDLFWHFFVLAVVHLRCATGDNSNPCWLSLVSSVPVWSLAHVAHWATEDELNRGNGDQLKDGDCQIKTLLAQKSAGACQQQCSTQTWAGEQQGTTLGAFSSLLFEMTNNDTALSQILENRFFFFMNSFSLMLL